MPLNRALALSLLLVVPASMSLAQEAMPACQAEGDFQFLSTRPSPLDSLTFTVGGKTAKVCYSRPSARGRIVMDSLVPFGTSWRTGANEPTTIHLPTTAEIAGVTLNPGRYIVLTVPSQSDWVVVFNTTQETDPARMLRNLTEVGRGVAKSERLPAHVEKFTITAAGQPATSELILDWERTRVRVPLTTPRR